MSLNELLSKSALFVGLDGHELDAVERICVERQYPAGAIIIQQGEVGNEMFIIQQGQVEIVIMGPKPELPVVVLGKGQVIGEMSLLDFGFRSATARAAEPTTVQVITEQDFTALCNKDHRIGFVVMRNLAADLSFKLRHRNLATM